MSGNLERSSLYREVICLTVDLPRRYNRHTNAAMNGRPPWRLTFCAIPCKLGGSTQVNTEVAGTAASTKLSELNPKMELRGKIIRIELFGAFVDVGAEREGFLHISQLRKDRTNRVEDVVNLGQDVT